jgi:hypothetical protein
MSSQNPGTQQNRDDHKSPQQGQHGQDQSKDKEQKQGARKDPSRGNDMNPGGDADRSRKPGQKSGQS